MRVSDVFIHKGFDVTKTLRRSTPDGAARITLMWKRTNCIRAVKLDPATHTARWSLKRINGTTGMKGLSVAAGRMIVAFGELTGDIWLEEKP